jgi:hypothetical protein
MAEPVAEPSEARPAERGVPAVAIERDRRDPDRRAQATSATGESPTKTIVAFATDRNRAAARAVWRVNPVRVRSEGGH